MKHALIFFLVLTSVSSVTLRAQDADDPWPIGVIARFDDHGTGLPLDVAVKMGTPTMQLKVPTKKNRTPENAELIVRKLKENGVELSCVLSGFAGESYASISIVKETVGLIPLATRKERIEEFKEVSDFTALLGCTVVQFHLGFVPHDTASQDYKDIVKVVRDACDYIKRHGQRLQLETGQETGAALLKFIKDVDRPNLAVNFDPANMILYGCGEPIDALKLVGKYVKSTHVKDAKWAENPGKDWGQEVLFGTGDVGAERFLQTLKEVGFRGTLTIERENKESPEHQRNDVLKTIELLKELKKKIL